MHAKSAPIDARIGAANQPLHVRVLAWLPP
jgi:hypothetical protein